MSMVSLDYTEAFVVFGSGRKKEYSGIEVKVDAKARGRPNDPPGQDRSERSSVMISTGQFTHVMWQRPATQVLNNGSAENVG